MNSVIGRGNYVATWPLGDNEDAGVWFTSGGHVWKCPPGSVHVGSKTICLMRGTLLAVPPWYVGEPAENGGGGGDGLLIPILIGAAVIGGLILLWR